MAKEAKSKGSPDQDLIRELAALLEETGLSEIEIEREGLRVRVARQQTVTAPLADLPAAVAAAGLRKFRAGIATPLDINADPALPL